MTTLTAAPDAAVIEAHGIDVIGEHERTSRPRHLFWPWFAGNVAVLNVAWGAYLLDYGIGFAQAAAATLLGAGLSFALVGIVSLAGQRGSAPTMVLSRAVFGRWGNVLPSVVSYLLLIGWETVLVSVGVLASGTIADLLGIGFGGVTQLVVFVVMVALVMGVGILGFTAVMQAQKWLGLLTTALTVVYIAATSDRVRFEVLIGQPSGPVAGVLGATVMVICGFGVGWTSVCADYSRYQPRDASRSHIVGWTTLGGSLPVVALIGYGLLLCGSDPALAEQLSSDPIGALATALPTWLLIPFWLVAMTGFVSGAILDLYSSGLALLTLGLPVQRWTAAAIDGVVMLLGTVYVVWIAADFLGPFEAFLIILGVPLAAWTGIFGADLIFRGRRGYDELDLDDVRSTGAVRWAPVLVMAATTVLGLGLVTSSLPWLAWSGFLLEPLGLGGRQGPWASSNIGVLVALVLSFVVSLPLTRHAHRRPSARAGWAA